jgi:small subunit ribosomal protein S2
MKLERQLGGLQSLTEIPAGLIIIDSKEEKTAVAEARKLGVPVVAVLNSDCDPIAVDYPIPANDAASSSVQYILDKLTAAYKEGLKSKKHD